LLLPVVLVLVTFDVLKLNRHWQ